MDRLLADEESTDREVMKKRLDVKKKRAMEKLRLQMREKLKVGGGSASCHFNQSGIQLI